MALRQIIVLPSGQEIRDITIHTADEINSFIASLNPNQFTVGVDMFEECPDKYNCVMNSVDFNRPNRRYGAIGYEPFGTNNNDRLPVDLTGISNSNCVYILSVRNSSDWSYFEMNSSGIAVQSGLIPDNSTRLASQDGQYRKLVIYKICASTIRSNGPFTFQDQEIPLGSGQIYAKIDQNDILTEVDTTSAGLWTNNASILETPNTASLQTSSSANYILEVYNNPPNSNECLELQYKIVYADYDGKGARDLGGKDNETLTKAMYTQYANILLPPGQKKFNFNGTDEDYVYIIDVSRSRYKYAMDPGNWQVSLASCSFSNDVDIDSVLENMQTASFKNDSVTLVDTLTGQSKTGKSIYYSSKGYDIVVGTLEDGVGTNYVSASIASSSLASGGSSYISTSNNPSNTTVIVQGARVFVWSPYYNMPGTGNDNFNAPITVTGSFRMNFAGFTTGATTTVPPVEYQVGLYQGSWTGSIKIPAGATIAPTIMSGSTRGIWNRDNDGKFHWLASTTDFNNRKIRLTKNFIQYKGALKWGAMPNYVSGVESTFGTTYNLTDVDYGQTVVTGSFTGSAEANYYTDGWGLKTYIATGSYETLPNSNGFVLIPVTSDAYGKFYPNHGILVLSGRKMDELGFNTNRSVEKNGYNTYRLFHSMKLVLDRNLTDLSGDALGFMGRSVDIKYNKYCFIRVNNRKFNHSNNPTYQSGSLGDIVTDFQRKNQAYFTSIGIYNENKELLAVGKISKALVSSMTHESLFTVKIGQ